MDDNIYNHVRRGMSKKIGSKRTIDGCHDETDLVGIRSACKMCVDLLLLGLVERNEAVKDVIASSGIVGTTLVVGEVVLHGADGKFLLEAVDLVQEEDDRGLNEPTRVANRVEQGQGFLHTVDSLVFEEELVVLGDGDKEENGGDILEAMNPLFTFGTLTTNIEHAVGEVANDESGFGDTGGLDTRTENVLVAGEVVGLSNALNRVKVASKIRLGNCKEIRSTYYLAESLSWYSRERRKHS